MTCKYVIMHAFMCEFGAKKVIAFIWKMIFESLSKSDHKKLKLLEFWTLWQFLGVTLKSTKM